MILQALFSYYESLEKKGQISSDGWEKVKVSYALEINSDGELIDVFPLKDPTEDGKKITKRDINLPLKRRKSRDITANFLWDNPEYFLGIGDDTKADETKKRFSASRAFHRKLLSEIDHPCAKAICAFFENWDVSSAKENPIIQPMLSNLKKSTTTNLVFIYNENFANVVPEIREVWQEYYDNDDEGEKMQCLITGKQLPIAATHPMIKGVDGPRAEAALVSHNTDKPAFNSFGKVQNNNAPVSKYAAFAYTSALNHLLADKAHKKRIGDATVVFWAEDAEPGYQDAFAFFVDGSSNDDNEITNQDLEALIKAIADGNVVNWENATIEPDNRFYVLALSPNAARISVRFFLRDSFGNMLKNLYAHYQRLEIVSDNRTKFKHIPLWALLRETINQKSTDKTPSPQMAGDTLKAILTGGLYPTTLYMQTQMRIRAEREITQGRAAIIKAYLLRNATDKNLKEVLTVELNEKTTYQPYVMGRLFSVLEEVQNQASGATSIKDKYFTSACATPSVVFPMILSLADKHLRKLEGGKKVYYAKRIGELMGMITESYPAHHNLHDQGIFQLGYYHQTQKRYEKKNNKESMEEN